MTDTRNTDDAVPVDVWVEAVEAEARRGRPTQTEGLAVRMGPWRRFFVRFLRDRFGMIAVCVVIAAILTAIFQSAIAPMDPYKQHLDAVLQAPNLTHLLGTDDLGRDLFSRLIYGTRLSLVAALQATAIAILLGLPLGLAAGYIGGAVDRAISFVNDAIMALPGLLLAIAIVGMLGPGISNAMVAVGIVYAPRILRIVRGSVMSVRQETYVEASRSIGLSSFKIVSQHVLPNVRADLLVGITLIIGHALLTEASLSFLGMGAQYPEASWGGMLGRALPFVDRAPFMIIYPGMAIALLVLAFNVTGDSLRDALGREERRG